MLSISLAHHQAVRSSGVPHRSMKESTAAQKQSMQSGDKPRLHFTRRSACTLAKEEADDLKQRLPRTQQVAMEQMSGRGASSWLINMASPSISKSSEMPYMSQKWLDWRPSRLPSHCLCGEVFSVSHALSCSKGAFPSILHNHIRDMLARFFTEVCPNVSIEPYLQLISGDTISQISRSANVDDGRGKARC